MKLTLEFEGNEKMTNIGLAKAIIDTEHFEAADLCEIGRYLIIYSESRTSEPRNIARVFDIHFDEKDCICKCPYKKE